MSLEHLCPYFGLVLSCNIVFVAKCIRDKDIIRIILYTWLIIIIFLLPLPISHALFTWPLLTHSPFSRSLTLTFDVPPPHVTSHYRHHYPFVPRPYPKNISPSSTRPSQKWLKIFPIKMTTSVPPICHWRVNARETGGSGPTEATLDYVISSSLYEVWATHGLTHHKYDTTPRVQPCD